VNGFRFGLHVVAPSGREEWVHLARQAEDLGFSVITVPDHLIDGCLAPFAALGVAAEATSTLRVGTLVLNNSLRHPALVAREALTLDVLSGGRLELGLGAGSTMSASEHGSIGLPFDDAATRVSRLAESVEVLDGLLRGNEVTFEGEHYLLLGHRPWPPATQSPRPPMLIGGYGRAVLKIGAGIADTVGLSGRQARPLASDAIDERVAFIRAASAGRSVELQVLVPQVAVTDEPRDAADRLRDFYPDLNADEILGTPYLWIGTVDWICDQLLAARERWGISYFTVLQFSLEAAAPIVRRLAGA
jgi:probable F420-dependent oxidoreductase